MKIKIKSLISILLVIFLSGCGTREFFGFEEKKIPLPGKRISVLKGDLNSFENIRTDSKVELSELEINLNWEQSHNSPTHMSKNLSAITEFNKFKRIASGKGEEKDSKILSQPVIKDNKIFYIDAKTNIIAYDLEAKRVIWKKNISTSLENDHNIGGGLAINENAIFVNSPYAEVLSINKENGALIWSKKVSSPLRSSPTLVNNRVLSITVDNRLLVLDQVKGELIWSHEGIPNNTSIVSAPKVAADQNILVVPYSNGDYFGLNLTNGIELWKGSIVDIEQTKTSNTFNDIDANPIFINNSVIIAGSTGKIISLDKRNGSENWARDFNTNQTPLVNKNSIYLINNNKEILNLDLKNGKIRWITKIKESLSKYYFNIWYSPILVNNKIVIVGGDKKLLTLNPFDGKIEKKVNLPSLPASSPFIANKKMYLNMRNGDIISFE